MTTLVLKLVLVVSALALLVLLTLAPELTSNNSNVGLQVRKTWWEANQDTLVATHEEDDQLVLFQAGPQEEDDQLVLSQAGPQEEDDQLVLSQAGPCINYRRVLKSGSSKAPPSPKSNHRPSMRSLSPSPSPEPEPGLG